MKELDTREGGYNSSSNMDLNTQNNVSIWIMVTFMLPRVSVLWEYVHLMHEYTDCNISSQSFLIDKVVLFQDGWTALICSASCNLLGIMDLLIQKKANLNIQNNVRISSSLLLIVMFSACPCVYNIFVYI